MATKTESSEPTRTVSVKAPNFKVAQFLIRGNAPYIQDKFGPDKVAQMARTQAAGDQAGEAPDANDPTGENKPRKSKKKPKPPKDHEKAFHDATFRGPKGEFGIPCLQLRNAMIRACKFINGFSMTDAKVCVFVEADFVDPSGMYPMVRILNSEPDHFQTWARNADKSVDIRNRPRFATGWEAKVRIRYDADVFTLDAVANLLMRAGIGGIGNGRPFSTNSNGCGWGTFDLVESSEAQPSTPARRHRPTHA